MTMLQYTKKASVNVATFGSHYLDENLSPFSHEYELDALREVKLNLQGWNDGQKIHSWDKRFLAAKQSATKFIEVSEDKSLAYKVLNELQHAIFEKDSYYSKKQTQNEYFKKQVSEFQSLLQPKYSPIPSDSIIEIKPDRDSSNVTENPQDDLETKIHTERRPLNPVPNPSVEQRYHLDNYHHKITLHIVQSRTDPDLIPLIQKNIQKFEASISSYEPQTEDDSIWKKGKQELLERRYLPFMENGVDPYYVNPKQKRRTKQVVLEKTAPVNAPQVEEVTLVSEDVPKPNLVSRLTNMKNIFSPFLNRTTIGMGTAVVAATLIGLGLYDKQASEQSQPKVRENILVEEKAQIGVNDMKKTHPVYEKYLSKPETPTIPKLKPSINNSDTFTSFGQTSFFKPFIAYDRLTEATEVSNREPFEIKYSKNYVQEKSSTVSRDSFSPEIEKQIQETLAAGYILSVNPEGEVYIHIDGRPLFEGVSRENSDTSAVTTQNELKIEMSNSETNNQSIDDKL